MSSSTPSSSNIPGGGSSAGGIFGPTLKYFLIALGSIGGLFFIALLSMILLRHVLMPSPLPRGKLTPSGAHPWQQFRKMASLHGFTTWHGTQPVQPQEQLLLPAVSSGGSFATEAQFNQNVPFSQVAPRSRVYTSPTVAIPVDQPLVTPQQPDTQNGHHAPTTRWNSTPYATYSQPASGWNGRTFASWKPPTTPDLANNGAKGNTGAFRRNSLQPVSDIVQPATNGVWETQNGNHAAEPAQ